MCLHFCYYLAHLASKLPSVDFNFDITSLDELSQETERISKLNLAGTLKVLTSAIIKFP